MICPFVSRFSFAFTRLPCVSGLCSWSWQTREGGCRWFRLFSASMLSCIFWPRRTLTLNLLIAIVFCMLNECISWTSSVDPSVALMKACLTIHWRHCLERTAVLKDGFSGKGWHIYCAILFVFRQKLPRVMEGDYDWKSGQKKQDMLPYKECNRWEERKNGRRCLLRWRCSFWVLTLLGFFLRLVNGGDG